MRRHRRDRPNDTKPSTSPEELLGWHPVRDAPARYRRSLERAQRRLADYLASSDVADLEAADAAWNSIVDDPRFVDAPTTFRFDLLNRAAAATQWMTTRTGALGDLDRAMGQWHDALELASAAWPERVWALHNLGMGHLIRFQLAGSDEELDAAVASMRAAMETAERTGGDLALAERGAASVLDTVFRARGDPDALERSIHLARDAFDRATRTGAARIDAYQYTLAQLLATRYDALGEIADLDAAIDVLAPNLDASPILGDGDARSSQLGSMLRRRWHVSGRLDDLDAGIELLDRALDAASARDPNMPARLTNLGNALLDHYAATGIVDDLVRAAEVQELAVERSGPQDYQLASRHNNAGNSSQSLYELTAERRHLDRALDHYERAIELTASDAPELASRQYNLGSALRYAHRIEPSPQLAERLGNTFESACRNGLAAGLEWSLTAALSWGDWAGEHGRWAEAGRAYRHALEATDRLSRRQLGRDEKESWLARATGLPQRAALALCRAGRGVDAVMAIERGRAFVLSEVLERDRADLTRLEAAGRGDLAERYRTTSRALRRASTPAAAGAARDDLEHLIGEIRTVRGCGDLLAAPEFDAVEQVAERAPIAYLASALDGGVAIVVFPRAEPVVVPLDGLSPSQVGQRVQALRTAELVRAAHPEHWIGTIDGVTSWLWRAAMEPLLDVLDTATATTLVPVGPLGLLPFHAAWTRDTSRPSGRRYVLDRLAITYAPNVRSLVATDSDQLDLRDDALVVADPQPSSAGVVPGAEVEAALIGECFATSLSLLHEEATKAAVLEALPHHQILHFACHGDAIPEFPLESGLELAHDERITVGDLIDLYATQRLGSFRPRFAILSACEASRPGDVLPDEVVGLPTALLQVGLSAVVAPQWPVDGLAAGMLIARLCADWVAHGDTCRALQQAQRWLRDTTSREKAEWFADRAPGEAGAAAGTPSRDVWRALVRMPPDELDHQRPDQWAAFTHVGSPC